MIEYSVLKRMILSEINKCWQETAELSEYIAANPEVSGTEYKSSERIVSLLKSHGFEVEQPFAGYETAFKGVFGKNDHKYKVAVLTEYDALPGIGHACGHNLSGAISVLSALACKDFQDELDCDIHVIGTPGEELLGSKCGMCDQGVFKEYDMAIMLHLYDQTLTYCKLNGLASYRYEFHGKASHAGAAPWDGQNALNAAQLMLHGLDCMRGCLLPDTRINSVISFGGEAAGSIPDEAKVETWIRSPDYEYLLKTIQRTDNCAAGAALMAECTWDKYTTAPLYKNMRRNHTGEDAVREVFDELEIPVNGDHSRLFGSSDIGNVSFECPAFQPTLQLSPKGIGIHTNEFLEYVTGPKARESLKKGAEVVALTIAKIFTDENRIKAIKSDFKK